ncbi:acyl-CoA dehydrogenase family protein [Actinomadura vinacea]|uniref:Acyl-CoA dehydrogenase family protein n=1 Tax=Actinomadura vinacea TaxID=115336 RepID=A0ABP5VR90_9ACTN
MTGVVELSEAELDELRSAVRAFLEAKSPEDAVRKAMEGDPRYDPQVWAQMADQLRLPGLAIPEEYGGDGFGQVALGAVLEEMGRALLCSPFFATVVLAAQALLASGDRDACARHLPGIAAGTTTAALAVAERTGAWDPVQITARAVRRTGDAAGWELTGTKSFVIDGTSADLLLVVARTKAGPSLFTVDRRAADHVAPGLTSEPMETLDATRTMARVRLESTPATLVGTDGAGGRLMARILDLAAVGLAAEQAGGAARCLESSTAYAGTRVQFGRLIGSFQAVKHKCADMLVQVELARASAREAARLADIGDEGFAVASAAAHVCCSRAYLFAATENIQVHGGIGFTWEHPAHLYFRRAKSSQLMLGGPSAYHERLLERLGI